MYGWYICYRKFVRTCFLIVFYSLVFYIKFMKVISSGNDWLRSLHRIFIVKTFRSPKTKTDPSSVHSSFCVLRYWMLNSSAFSRLKALLYWLTPTKLIIFANSTVYMVSGFHFSDVAEENFHVWGNWKSRTFPEFTDGGVLVWERSGWQPRPITHGWMNRWKDLIIWQLLDHNIMCQKIRGTGTFLCSCWRIQKAHRVISLLIWCLLAWIYCNIPCSQDIWRPDCTSCVVRASVVAAVGSVNSINWSNGNYLTKCTTITTATLTRNNATTADKRMETARKWYKGESGQANSPHNAAAWTVCVHPSSRIDDNRIRKYFIGPSLNICTFAEKRQRHSQQHQHQYMQKKDFRLV